IAVDSAEAPCAAAGGRNAILVQLDRDLLGRFADGISLEDATNDFGLDLIDSAIPTRWLPVAVELLHHIVAVAIATARLAHLNAAALSAPRLVGQIFQEQ